jgi:DNA invertase Pin-like site-specific DNA recombinase
MRHGYARVSSEDQDLSIQVEALEAVGCEVRKEKASGTKLDAGPSCSC